MKTLKILAMACIIIGFTSNNVNCQPIREEYPVYMGVNVPCLGEMLIGWVTWERTVWDNKIQIKVMDGVLIGRNDHLVYTVTEIINHEMWYDQSAVNDTFTRLLLIRLEGKLIARLPLKMHYTVNANGEETVDFTNNDVDCK
ncbi:MAG: hypothetical protein NTY95_15420 [Bacteroidia bacterium]|nr:hypothetical protein [Bacteroidia bacterium]